MATSGNPELTAGWITDPDGTLQKCLRAIRNSKGVIHDAASELGVDRRTFWRYIRDHKELAKELERMREAHHGRQPIWNGSNNKLTDKQREAIKTSKLGTTALAEKYDVSTATILRIRGPMKNGAAR